MAERKQNQKIGTVLTVCLLVLFAVALYLHFGTVARLSAKNGEFFRKLSVRSVEDIYIRWDEGENGRFRLSLTSGRQDRTKLFARYLKKLRYTHTAPQQDYEGEFTMEIRYRNGEIASFRCRPDGISDGTQWYLADRDCWEYITLYRILQVKAQPDETLLEY